jgi:transcriptional regulator with XRE-family HTH domain
MVVPSDLNLGDALLMYRTAKGWDQDGMAVTLKISQVTYWKLENNKTRLTQNIRGRILAFLPEFKHPLITP